MKTNEKQKNEEISNSEKILKNQKTIIQGIKVLIVEIFTVMIALAIKIKYHVEYSEDQSSVFEDLFLIFILIGFLIYGGVLVWIFYGKKIN